MSATKFLILVEIARAEGNAPTWSEVATVEAASKDAALRSIGGNAGTYVAVPVRSWHPVKLTVEKVERVKLSAIASVQSTPKADA